MQYVSGTPSLVDRSRHYAGDPSAAPNPIWTDAEHKVSINIAYDDLLETARRIGGRTWGHKIGYITTVAGTETYTLPSDFVAMLSLAISENGSNLSTVAPTSSQIVYLTESDTELARRNYDTQASTSPSEYFIQDTSLAILPPITSSEAGTNACKLVYQATGTALSADGDEPVFPRPHHDLIGLYSAKLLLGSRNLPFPYADLLQSKLFNFRAYCQRVMESKRNQIPVEGLPSMRNRWSGANVKFGKVQKY